MIFFAWIDKGSLLQKLLVILKTSNTTHFEMEEVEGVKGRREGRKRRTRELEMTEREWEGECSAIFELSEKTISRIPPVEGRKEEKEGVQERKKRSLTF